MKQLKKLCPTLKDQHFIELNKGSGLSKKMIQEHGFRSISANKAKRLLKRKGEVGEGYIIPYPSKDGFLNGVFNFKPDTPLPSNKKGKKPRKYVRPFGQKSRLYIPVPVWRVFDDVTVPIYVTEGEKKALKAIQEGFITVAISGVWNWSSNKKPIEDFDLIKLHGRTIYLVFDGDKHTNKNILFAEKRLAEALVTKGAIVKIIDLPEDKNAMKLDDFLINCGVQAFKDLVADSYEFLGGKIIVNSYDVKDITDKSWQVIVNQNQEKPTIFQFGTTLTVLEKDRKKGIHNIKLLDDYSLRYYLIRWAEWRSVLGCNLRPYVHTKTVLEDILATPDKKIPFLEGVVFSPIFTSDGMLIDKFGYSEKTELFYSPPKGFFLPQLSRRPVPSEIKKAKEIILSGFLGDFPFVGLSERCHAVALLLLSFVRNLIDAPTPLHVIDKSTPGTGATLLARAISYVCTGSDFTTLPEGRDSEEWRKRLTAVLKNSPIFLVIDNLGAPLDSTALSIAITSQNWEDRLLGKSLHISVPIRCAWVATGNNPILSYELARRSVRIRLDAKTESPHLRDVGTFKHPKLIKWVQKNRSSIVWAVLVLIQNWVNKGMPKGEKSLGGFEEWAEIIGGILETNEIKGFLENSKEFYEDVQTELEQKKVLISIWYKKYGEKSIRVADLFKTPAMYDALSEAVEFSLDRSGKTKLGLYIKKLKDQVFELDVDFKSVNVVVRMAKQKIENTTAWKLEVLGKKLMVKKKKEGP